MPNALYLARKCMEPTTTQQVSEKGVFAVVIGHLGKDPQISYSASGLTMAKGSVAVSWGKRGEPNQKTEWVNYIAWRDKADVIGEMFKKGDAICLIGEPKARTWTTRDGEERTEYELTVWEVSRPVFFRSGAAPAANMNQQAQAGGHSEPDDPDIPF